MTTEKGRRAFARLGIATAVGALAALAVFGGPATSSPGRTLAEVRVVTLPIANGFPLDLGIKKGFFAQQGIEIKKTTLQSGNDVVLALANGNGDIGYLGFVPMYIAVTSGIPRHSPRRARSKEPRRRTTGRTSWSRARARSTRLPTCAARRSPSTR